MNIKRHHVLYGLLALVLIFGLVFLFYPHTAAVSYIPLNEDTASATASTSVSGGIQAQATSSVSATSAVTAMRFEVVTTAAAQEQGLGGRADIPANYGMIFVFPVDKSYGFWMKDMLTSIDMIWLSDKGIILAIDASVSPSTYPKAFYPPQPVRLVLETRAGEAARRGWTVGSDVHVPSAVLSSSVTQSGKK